MRPWMLIVLAVICGACMGLGVTFAELGTSPAGHVQAAFQLGLNGSTGPKAAIDEDTFEFGNMELNDRNSHEFTIRNEGHEPLELKEGGVSCGLCTEQSLKSTNLAPGEKTVVEIRWHANKEGPFHQSAVVNTNDPARPRLTFNIAGKVLFSHRVEPSDLVFSSISAKEPQSAEVLIYSFRDGQLQALSSSLSELDTADKFEIRTEPMPKEKLDADKDAKSGVVVHVTLKPGLPLGALHQKILLKLNLEGEPTVEIPVSGNVVSEVQLMGRNWDSERGLLRLDTVSSGEGTKAQLYLQIHIANGEAVHPKVVEVNPASELKVTIGDAMPLAAGTLVRVPLTIEIPRGTRPVSHLGGDEGKLGEIVIDTGDAGGEKLKLRVRYAVVE